MKLKGFNPGHHYIYIDIYYIYIHAFICIYILYMHTYIYIWNITEHLKIKRPPVDIFVTCAKVEPPTIHGAVGDAPSGHLETWCFPVYHGSWVNFLEGFSGFCCWKLPQGTLGGGGIFWGEYRI